MVHNLIQFNKSTEYFQGGLQGKTRAWERAKNKNQKEASTYAACGSKMLAVIFIHIYF